MRVTLVMNPNAGDGSVSRLQVESALKRRGDRIALVSSKDPGLESALADPGELVVAAGGDGTVALVAKILLGRNVPILVAPVGTANNIAESLGVGELELDLDVVRKSWRTLPVNAAIADGEIIVESAGCGAVTYLLDESLDDGSKGVRRKARALGEHLEDVPGSLYRVSSDEGEWHGTAMLIEAMVMPQIGPNLRLAPAADPSDGLLELVIVGEGEREDLLRYLRSGGRDHKLPQTISARGSRFTIECQAPWHFDDEPRPSATRTVSVHPAVWSALVPPAG